MPPTLDDKLRLIRDERSRAEALAGAGINTSLNEERAVILTEIEADIIEVKNFDRACRSVRGGAA